MLKAVSFQEEKLHKLGEGCSNNFFLPIDFNCFVEVHNKKIKLIFEIHDSKKVHISTLFKNFFFSHCKI